MAFSKRRALPLTCCPAAVCAVLLTLGGPALFPTASSAGEPAPAPGAADDSVDAEFPLLVRTRKVSPVKKGASKSSALAARIYPGAVLRARRKGGSRGCPRGWLEREGGGYVCYSHVKRLEEGEPGPAPRDLPDATSGSEAIAVTRRGPRLYRTLRDLDRDRPYVVLREGSVLRARGTLTRKGEEYIETRSGWYVESRGVEKLPPSPPTLAVEAREGASAPGAIVVAPDGAPVRARPDAEAEIQRRLDRWETIPRGGDGRQLSADGGWVPLPGGGFASDEDLARVRPAPFPRRMEEEERWIAVDLDEQVLHAYQGERLLRVVPCSTGARGNTRPGTYRVQWKRRMQTMRLRRGSVRVEDVQWVMYYDRKRSIAIHSAYWHSDFGSPVSHGCVNLPVDDARWLFEWSSPAVLPQDSERFPVPGEPGTRIVVFRRERR